MPQAVSCTLYTVQCACTAFIQRTESTLTPYYSKAYANTQHSHCAVDTRKRRSRADSRKARRLLDVSARLRMCVLLRTHNRGVPIGDCGGSNMLRQAHCCTANSGTLAFGADLTARGARATTWVSRTERVRVTCVAVRVQAGRRDRFATSQQLCIDL
jgi:hypothetical protein